MPDRLYTKFDPVMAYTLDLKRFRQEFKLSQADLARAFGMSKGSVVKWECTGIIPSWLPWALDGFRWRSARHLDNASPPTGIPLVTTKE